jgi:DNA-binding transcriptional MocR family regulator
MWAPEISRRPGPRYVAIAEALADDAAAGRLRPGTRLPTHRELADRLGVTVGTVTRAYAEAARRGLVSGEVGRGTFVRGAAEMGAPDPPAGLVDLSVNHPPPLPGEAGIPLARTLAEMARRRDLLELLAYPPEGGAAEHREAGARWIRGAGLPAAPEQVLVSSGSQHGMTAVFSALVRPGDVVATEAVTYPGMRSLAGLLHLRLLGLPMDRDGLLPDAFERACRGGSVKALYAIPTLQNPTASVMPEARRREVARIADAHGVVVVEDDVHSHLLEDAPRPLACFAPERTVYLTGTAKTLAPGLRVGFVHAPRALVPRLAAAIRATTWMAPPLTAEIAATWIRDGTAEAIVRRRRKEAAARHKLAAEALSGFDFDSHPAAYHLWLHLPEQWRREAFADAARHRGVLVAPPTAFAVSRSIPDAVRVCLGGPSDRQELARGLAAIAATLVSVAAEAGVLAAAGP